MATVDLLSSSIASWISWSLSLGTVERSWVEATESALPDFKIAAYLSFSVGCTEYTRPWESYNAASSFVNSVSGDRYSCIHAWTVVWFSGSSRADLRASRSNGISWSRSISTRELKEVSAILYGGRLKIRLVDHERLTQNGVSQPFGKVMPKAGLWTSDRTRESSALHTLKCCLVLYLYIYITDGHCTMAGYGGFLLDGLAALRLVSEARSTTWQGWQHCQVAVLSWQQNLTAWLYVPAGILIFLLTCFGVNSLIGLSSISFPASVALLVALFFSLLLCNVIIGDRRTRALVNVIDVPVCF